MEVDALIDELFYGHSALDVGAAVGLQVGNVGHWDVEEPQDDVEALSIDSDRVVCPHCHSNCC